ncbi:MAG: hypothetical protein JW714_05335 [Candidatus Omnitrophica bacterium]|nr:hypothetical protein [Candidatus Omnitrophota bacterium]
MKKFVVCSLWFTVIAILFYLVPAQAAQVGSPASLIEKGKWDFSLEGGYVSERPMKKSGASDYHVNIGYGGHARSYGLTERLTIKGLVGGSYGRIYDENATTTIAKKTSLSGGLALGLELLGIIFENESSGFEWDASAQFLYLRSHHKRSGKANADWYEWQLSSCVAKELGWFKPYAGVKLSIVDLDHDDGKGNTASYEQDGIFSPFVGTDIYLGKDRDVVINLEGAFLLGTELYGAIRYRF